MARRKLKVGMSLWHVYADPEDRVEIWHYVIKSIRKQSRKSWQKHPDIIMPVLVRVVHKCSVTWGKRSRKNFDYGWLPNIPSEFQNTFKLEDYEKDGLPKIYSFTRAGAYKYALGNSIRGLKKVKQDLKNDQYDEEDVPEINDYIKLYEKLISKLKGLYTKSKKSRK